MVILFALAMTLSATPVYADRVLKNGKIWTVDSVVPEAEAFRERPRVEYTTPRGEYL